MLEMNYQPKFFKCKTTTINRIGNKTVFKFGNGLGQTKEISVDETIDRIKSRMDDVIQGKRDAVYLTNGMMNVNIDLLSNGNWQLFDEFDIYEFSI